MTARVVTSLADVDARQWNALVGPGAPFLRHEFLLALEASASASPATGWSATHLLIDGPDGRLAAALPLYLKPHSWGEFVFDFTWAEAHRRAGLAYYPRLVSAVPFTPATGPRLLARAGDERVRLELVAAARALLGELGLSSWHLLFPSPGDRELLRRAGLLARLDCQFHWFNDGYASFDDFLSRCTAEKRKKIRRERRRVAEAGIRFQTLAGGELDDRRLAQVHELHAGTFARYGNAPYLTGECFRMLARVMPESLVVELALRRGEMIACAVSFRGDDALYGRYWGAAADYHSLHFETCYYRGIDYCIARGLARFEPGTQGEHKLLRGFTPTPVWSLHEIADPRFAAAISDWLARERRQRRAWMREAVLHLPFRREDIPARLPVDVRDCLAAED